MSKESKPDVAVVTPLILAAGAVLWRPHDVTGTPEKLQTTATALPCQSRRENATTFGFHSGEPSRVNAAPSLSRDQSAE